jgi:acyl-CoA reductase-like NAD-dependent aldehyde dehydrogenase
MVSFTGSVQTGARIGAACGELIRPCVLELGGKSAAIVLEDAKLEDVLPVLIGTSVGTNSGQSCVAQTRLLVPESQYDTYAEALAEGFASLKVGDPMDADTVVGPLITAAHRDRVEHYVDLARKEGATIATGGRRPPHLDRGWFYEPTLITNADNDMRVSREEIFGPVASLIPHRGEDDAVRIANDSELGLAGSVFTKDTEHGFEIARRVRTGTFSVNTFAADLGSPFGGYKKSGLGREHGPYAVQEYLVTKTISIDPSQELPESVTAGVPRGTGPGAR